MYTLNASSVSRPDNSSVSVSCFSSLPSSDFHHDVSGSWMKPFKKKKMQNHGNFSQSEEAFLLRSVHEVVQVWARGTGQATMNLQINDGVANLKLEFSLGHPAEPHYPLPPCDQPHHDPAHHETRSQEQVRHHRRRGKGPNRRARDKIRAELYHARKQQQNQGNATTPDVVLPFHGKILPVKTSVTNVSTSEAVSASSFGSSTAVTPPSIPTSFSTARPRKSTSAPSAGYEDVSLAKKDLFHSKDPPPAQESPPSKKSFKSKEDDLWTKIFVS